MQPADAADIRQEVLSAVFHSINDFHHNGRTGAFRSWLRKITANRMRRVWRRTSHRHPEASVVNLSDLADELADDRSRLTAIWDRQHDLHVLRTLFHSLHDEFNQKHIEAVSRVALDDEPIETVAKDLGLSIGAIRVAQHRMLVSLRRRMN